MADAEFDWCGSTSVHLGAEEDSDLDGFEENAEVGSVLSMLARVDYEVTDPDAVRSAGRAAYLETWQDEEAIDAATRIQDITGAASELLHRGDLNALDVAPGLSRVRHVIHFVLHDPGEEAFDADPFGIVPAESDAPQ
ncbi:MAG: hypothetical protein ABI131_12195 [Nostocoides sp.]